MELETVALHNHEAVFSTQFNDARIFALSPRKGQTWRFFLAIDHQRLFARFKNGITTQEWVDGISLWITMVGNAELFKSHLLYR